MPKPHFRYFGLLLVFCLTVDPVTVGAFASPSPYSPITLDQSIFNEQALSVPMLLARRLSGGLFGRGNLNRGFKTLTPQPVDGPLHVYIGSVFAVGAESHLAENVNPAAWLKWFFSVDRQYQFMMVGGLVISIVGIVLMRRAWPQKRVPDETEDERVNRRKREEDFALANLVASAGGLVMGIGLMSAVMGQLEILPAQPIQPSAPLLSPTLLYHFVTALGIGFLWIGLQLTGQLFHELVAKADTSQKTLRSLYKKVVIMFLEWGGHSGSLISLAERVAKGTETMTNAIDLVGGDPEAIDFIRAYGEYYGRVEIGIGVVIGAIAAMVPGLYGAILGQTLNGTDETTAFIKALSTGFGLLAMTHLIQPKPLRNIRNNWIRFSLAAAIGLVLAQWWFGIFHASSVGYSMLGVIGTYPDKGQPALERSVRLTRTAA